MNKLEMLKNSTNEEILSLYNKSDNYFVNKISSIREKKNISDIAKGNISDVENEYIKNRAETIIVMNSLNNNDLISSDMIKTIFEYKPSELVNATTNTNSLNLDVPVVESSADGINVVGKFDFSTTSSEKAIAEVSETLLKDSLDILKQAMNIESNIKIEDKIIAALNSATLQATTVSEAVNKLSRKHLQNLSIVINPGVYLSNATIWNQSKIPVYFAPVENIFIGNLKAIVSNAVISKLKLDKDVKTGMCVLVTDLYSLGASLIDKAAIVKIS